MSNDAPVALPASRKDLRAYALEIREAIGCENDLQFPVMYFLEWFMPKMFPGFELVIKSKDEMGNRHGQACPEEKIIYLREDVYDGAVDGQGRDRMTVAHEIGHFLLHGPGNVSYARMEKGKKLELYRNPEWQADAFAGELLIPAHLIRGMSPFDIQSECGVSHAAAAFQLSKT